MSEEETEQDVLLRALRELPRPETGGAAQDRARREARATFQRAKAGDRSFRIGAFAVPAVLAGVVFVYLGWAIATVNALAQ
jgi:hypothetical protein